MTVQAEGTRAKDTLLAETIDIEALIGLRRLVNHFASERREVQTALAEIDKRGLSETEARKAVAQWALGRSGEAFETASKVNGSALASLIAGTVSEESSDLEDALKHYKQAAKLAPSSAPCVLRQISAMRRLGNVEEALELVEKLRREFSDKAELAYLEGRCLEEQGRQQDALNCYERAIAVDPEHPESIYHAARVCYLRGLDEEAKELLLKITSGAGSSYANACLMLATIYEDRNECDKAAMLCKKVLRANPRNKRARLFLGNSEASSNMYYSPEETKQSEQLEAILRVPVSDFELSVRSRNCLANMDIRNLGDLVKKTESEMLAYKNFGETSLREIKEMLSSRGLRLGMLREDGATRASFERRQGDNQEMLNKSINELEFGVRARKCMDNLGITTIGELVANSEADLARAKNFGRVSLNEIKKRLVEMGLSLRDPRT